MVKVYGPMFSLDASGTIADSATFSKWKGRNYVRQRVVPSNPQSGPQTGMRAMLSFLSKAWASLSAANKATWDTRGKATVISNFNAFTSYNQTRWRSYKGPSKEDPAAEASAAATAPTTTVTGGIRQAQLSIADGGTPPDWGYLIYRSTTTGFTPAYSNCVAIIPKTASPTVYIDAGLTAGTYYYRVGGFNADGVKGALEAEKSGAVT
jgi:hypothetical protein